jgi:hypothetical protein
MNLRLFRGLAGATTLALLATGLLSSAATAANQRDVYFGSPPTLTQVFGGGFNADGTLDFGELINADPVTVGRKAATTLLVRNDGGQSLNHVRIAGGTAADNIIYNPLFPAPDLNNDDVADLSLPASAATIRVLEGSATCDPSSGASFECNLGTLAPNAFVKFLLIVTAPASVGPVPYWVTGSWAEGWSSTGTNADYQFAVGTLDVKTGCGNGSSSWFLGGEQIDLDDGAGTGSCAVSGSPATGEEAAVKSGGNLVAGNGGFATMAIDNGFNATCPAGYRCLGHTITATILGGDTAPGGVRWTARWYGTKTIAAVVHFTSGGTTIIPLSKKFKCGATPTLTTNCWENVTTSSGNVKPAWVEVVWITDGNGKGGGLY